MWNSRSVQIHVRLPSDVAAEAEKVQRSDPDFLSRVILYGLTRRAIYRRLREQELHARPVGEDAHPTQEDTHAPGGVAEGLGSPHL